MNIFALNTIHNKHQIITNMKIAIIGAGVSGLANAYYLKKMTGADITIYEKSDRVGGNVNTFNVTLDNGRQRWVDMGVNDFNKVTYTHLVQLWQELGIMDASGQSAYCSPLINSEAFYTTDSGYRYAIGTDGKVFVPGSSTANQTVIQGLSEIFKKDLGEWFNQHTTPEANTTVGNWINSHNFIDEFVKGNLYPRMNGMYFTMEDAPLGVAPPSQMPLWMVAHYYVLQEGYGQQDMPPDARQYFVNGSQSWLDYFAGVIQSKGVNFKFNLNQLRVDRYNGRMTVYNGSTKLDDFDKVIFATHADDTFNMMGPGLKEREPWTNVLIDFSYSTCNVIAHQDHSVLTKNEDINCTYNIHIYDYTQGSAPQAHSPYTITYICNYHQNDPAKKINDPLFFVSVNPYVTINPNKILRKPDGTQAVTTFKHCKLDKKALLAQVTVNKYQLLNPGGRDFYFAGSFAIGAGLHEECIIQAQEIAKKILNPSYVSDQVYDFESTDRHFAPRYIRNAITRIAKAEPEAAADAMQAEE